MKLELVSHALCPYVHRAAIMLREKGVAFDKTYIDLERKPDWFVKISPRGKVPVLIAGGIPLFESLPIIEFLDETHPPALMPQDPFERARQRAWVEVANDLLLGQYDMFSTAGDAAVVKRGLDATLLRFEEALRTKLIDPDRFGIVGICVAPALHRFAMIEQRTGLRFAAAAPRVEAWGRQLAARPSIADTVPADFGDRFVKYFVDRGGAALRT